MRGRIVCQQKGAAAAPLWPALVEAHEAWASDIMRGECKSAAGDRVCSLSEQVKTWPSMAAT
jgi:hypothetical protein